MTSYNITLRAKGGIDKYPSKSHARRVAAKAKIPSGFIAIEGATSSFYPSSDQKTAWRQDRYFYYLSGCNEPDCAITYDIQKDHLVLYLPQVDYTRYYYDGRGSTVEEALEKYDIDEAKYLPEHLQNPLEFIVDAYASGPVLTLSHLTGSQPYLHQSILQRAMDTCRAVKDEHEIELIRKANEITAAAHKDVLTQLHTCKSEYEAEAVYVRRCVASLAKQQAYDPILGAGVNASFLHYNENVNDFGDSQLLLIDAGCEWQLYASDVTRTIPLNRKSPGYWPSEEAQKLYEAVASIQEACIRMMKPGVKFSVVALTAQHLSIDALLKLGVLKGDHDDIWKTGTVRAFFPHGLGHHMGLEVHDVSPPAQIAASDSETCCELSFDWGLHAGRRHKFHSRPLERYARSWTSPLISHHDSSSDEPAMEAGNVITVEPGLYFNRFVLEEFFLPHEKHTKFIDQDVLKKYIPLGGVRIEDDILIIKTGYENLTTAPKGEEALKILRRA